MPGSKNQYSDKIKKPIVSYYNSFCDHQKSVLKNCLTILLPEENIFKDTQNATATMAKQEIQDYLYDINERTQKRKSRGVYYTSEDVCNYITYNSIVMHTKANDKKIYSCEDAFNYLQSLDKKIQNKILHDETFLDPTCGSGEFLLSLYRIKFNLLTSKSSKYNDNDLLDIVRTIYGNDIEEESTNISKLRIFIEVFPLLKSEHSAYDLAITLSNNFTNYDLVNMDEKFAIDFDYVIGNPPYIENNVYQGLIPKLNNYGNVYGNVMLNSLNCLKDGGVLGFIVPLSYSSTSRMNKLRSDVSKKIDKEFILSYADRPDCLFSGVHQKLNIVLCEKGGGEVETYTSNYQYWYKNERNLILTSNRLQKVDARNEDCVPKLGNDLERKIYEKIKTKEKDSIYAFAKADGIPVYINCRACFWIKCFSFNPGSNEFKCYHFDKDLAPIILCILNSSLFWLYWNIVSDGWHITQKELKGFRIPSFDANEIEKFKSLSAKLERNLENTKVYIGSAQTEYEYKHKYCKDVIDEIDDILGSLYELTDEEIEYVKKFRLKYRTGEDYNAKSN